jgi:hypothetical protein
MNENEMKRRKLLSKLYSEFEFLDLPPDMLRQIIYYKYEERLKKANKIKVHDAIEKYKWMTTEIGRVYNEIKWTDLANQMIKDIKMEINYPVEIQELLDKAENLARDRKKLISEMKYVYWKDKMLTYTTTMDDIKVAEEDDRESSSFENKV